MSNEIVSVARARIAASNGRGRTLREAARISQGELAQAVGVSQACLSRWETGDRLPRGEAAERYGRLLRRIESELSKEPVTA